MKKLYTLTVMLLIGAASLFAQEKSYVQLVEKNAAGEFVALADGATVTRATVTLPEDEWDDPYVSSGLHVKNLKAENLQAIVEYTIESISNGGHKICYSGVCLQNAVPGTFYYPSDYLSSKGNIVNVVTQTPGEPKSIEAEWVCISEGSAKVTYKVSACVADGTETVIVGGRPTSKTKYKVVESTSVTVNYLNDPTGAGIDGTTADEAVKTEYYDVTGKRIAEPQNGLFVKKTVYSDGSLKTRKVVK